MVSSLSNSFSVISLPKARHANAFCLIIIHSFIHKLVITRYPYPPQMVYELRLLPRNQVGVVHYESFTHKADS